MIRRPPRSTQGVSSAASDVYKRQVLKLGFHYQIEKEISSERKTDYIAIAQQNIIRILIHLISSLIEFSYQFSRIGILCYKVPCTVFHLNIRDFHIQEKIFGSFHNMVFISLNIYFCLLYTSDAADDTPCVDLGGRRIIKKKKKIETRCR
eukprot:TRINITY_DN8752_c0_g1_i11.p1 TRINITY_DN8752_c0_g1~~TRINITY_DN8752_c0_g1_i11.p1  ORF type:complete len:150 (+),score=19.43 TRINITY_DN8752_c0_g1_i11:146-595(+)